MERLLVLLAGIAGAAGVALAAAGSHLPGGALLTTASSMLVPHAAALLTLGLAGGARRRPLLSYAGLLMSIGLALFAGDLAMRALVGRPLASFAAPVGGTLIIASWAMIAVGALLPSKA